MFDISALKEMKLSELQEIAKLAKTIKTAGVKKEALIQLILEQQAESNQQKVADKPTETTSESKPKRARILPEKVALENKVQKELFSSDILEEIPAPSKPISIAEKHLNKTLKFKKSIVIAPNLDEPKTEESSENVLKKSEETSENISTEEPTQNISNQNPN